MDVRIRPRALALVGLAGLVIVSVAVRTLWPDGVAGEVAYQSAFWGASAAAWLGRARTERGTPDRRLATLVAWSITLTAVGDSVWNALTARDLYTDLSVADLAWISSYVLLGRLLWQMEGGQDPRHHRSSLVDLATVLFVSGLLFWRFSVDVVVGDDSAPLAVRLVWAVYPLADAVLLALIMRVLLIRGVKHLPVGVAGGVLCWLVADVLYLHSPEGRVAVPVMDAAWMIAPALLATAAWPREVRRDPDPQPRSPGWVALLVVAIAPLLVPPAFELLGDLQGTPDRPGQLLVSTVVLTGLALVRTGSLLRSVERSNQRMAEAQRAAEQASEAKSLLLSNVSHEFRTPLTTILAATEFVRETDLDPVQADLMARVDRSAMTLQRLVEQILDFSRLEHDSFVLADDTFSLRTLLSVVTEEYADRAAARGLQLTSAVEAAPSLVRGDPKRVWQMISGLVDNAVKFTQVGCIELTLESEPASRECATRFCLRVRDTGIGIAVEQQRGIFEAFTQVDASATREVGGTGLGLALSRRLAEQMGGSLEVVSEVGEGSTFTLTFELGLVATTEAGPRTTPRVTLPAQTPRPDATHDGLMPADS